MKKENIIFILFFIASVLLIFRVAIDFTRNEGSESIDKETVLSLFLDAMDASGIEDKWIEVSEIKDSDDREGIIFVKVRLPRQILLPLILNELNEVLVINEFSLYSSEIKSRQTTESVIKHLDKTALKATFIYDPSIYAKQVAFSFIVSGFDKLSLSNKEEIIGFPVQLSIVLVPSEENAALTSNIKKAEKEYFPCIGDEARSAKYKLDKNFNKQRLKRSLAETFGSFSESKLFIYNPGSEIARSAVFPFIKEEFNRRNISLISLGVFKKLTGGDYFDLASKLKFYIESGQYDNSIFLIDARELILIKNELAGYKKKGIMFMPATKLESALKSDLK